MFVIRGPYHIRGEYQRDQHGRGFGERLRRFSEPDGQVFRDAAGILHAHPLHSALPGRHCFDLHVRPRSLHAQERTAEAYRGRAQGDNDVLAARNGVFSDFDELLIKTFWSNLL